MIPEAIQSLLPFFNKKNQNVTASIPGISDKQEKVDYILSDFNAALDFESNNLERTSEAWKLYDGTDNSQYPDEIKAKMEAEGRNIFQANFIQQKVEGLAGSIIKNFYDISFEPINADHSNLTRNLKELMFVDKELLDWSASYREVVVDGLVQLGVEEMYIDFRYSPLGHIGFRRIMPGHILLDPHWLSNNAWDLKRAYKVAYLTVKEIKDTYNTKSQEIDDLLRIKQAHATDYDNGDNSKGYPHYGTTETYGDKYRVIEYHHIEKEKHSIEIVVADGTVVPEGTDEFKQEWAILNNVDLSEGVIKQDKEIDVYYVTTICPAISRYLVLEDKKGLIQIGRLPLFPWSVGRKNGRNSGIPDLLKSIQQTYNYRESMLDYMISTSAAGGIMMDPEIVDNDAYKMQRIEKNWNKPKFREWSAPGALASGRSYFQELPRNQMDYGIVNEINRLMDMADRVSKQPSVMDGRSEGSEETGILYARKQLQAEITHTLMVQSLEQLWNEKGEAWLLLAKQLYSGVYREFFVFGEEGKKIELNKPTFTPSGEVVDNDISQLPRMKVIVSQSPEGVTNRAVDRAINTELLRVIGAENPLSRAQAVKNVMKTLDNSKEERKRYEESAELEYQLAKENMITQMLGLKAQQVQIQMQMSQMGGMGGMGGQEPPAEQPEQPAEPPQPQGNPDQSVAGQNANIAQGLV